MVQLLGGRYELTSTLARGSRSDIFLAHDRRLERDCCVKLLSDGGNVERFRRDMLALAGIDDEHLPVVYDLVVGDDVAYAVTRHVEGEPMNHVLRPMPLARATRMMIDVLEGLAALRPHRASCDLDPSHVVIGPTRAYLFGIRARETIESEDVTRVQTLFGALLGDVMPPAFSLIASARYPTLGAMASALMLGLRQLE